MIKKRVVCFLIALSVLFSFPAFSEENTTGESGILEVHFLCVGTNDAILLTIDGESAFIDSGNYSEGVYCAEYLKNYGVSSLKYYIASHYHLDHIGGAPAIVSAIETESLVYSYDRALEAMYIMAQDENEIAALDQANRIPMNYLDSITLGGATLTCVGPKAYVKKHGIQDTSENNNSILLHVTYGDISFFLTGDSPSWKVLEMAKSHPEVLSSNVIKAPHHRGGFDKSVYKLMDTDYVVFSTAGTWLPLKDQMTWASQASDHILITADNRNGWIRFFTDGKTLRVETEFEYDYSAE